MARGAAAAIGAERVSQNGYHYTKTVEGWVLTHRKVAEEVILGRPLQPDERVNFRNRNRLDLRPENLIVTKVKTDLSSLKKRRLDIISRIEELQGQLADLEEEINRRELIEEQRL
jgi:hypothetical protein